MGAALALTDLQAAAGPRRYHLLERIGSGAFGDVYLAELESGGFRRRVALKVLNEAAAQRRSARRRIQEEARILGRLAHRNIVAALDFVRVGKGHAIVMDYVQGADLDHVLTALDVAREALPMRAAFEIAAAVADALHAAFTAPADDGHPLGIVHRDIKPSNLRLTPDGEVKVLDFGIALTASAPEAPGRPIVGTEVYMAPERFTGAADDPAVDVFSLGVTLLEMLAGRTLGPPAADRLEHAERVAAALDAVRPSLAGGPPDLVADITATLEACLSYEARARPTADALAERFEAFAEQIPGEGARAFCRRFVPTVGDRVGAQAEPVSGVWTEEVGTGFAYLQNGTLVPVEAHSLGVDEAAPRRGVGWGWVAAAVLLLAACAAAGIGLAWRLRGEAAPAPVEVAAPAPEPTARAEEPVVPESAPESAPVGPATVAEPRPARSVRPVVAPTSVAPAPVSGPTVEKAQFSVRDASRLQVACGDRTGVGTSSVRLTSFPAGPCRLTAEYVGRTVTGVFSIERVGQVRCEVVEERLSCSTP